MSSFAFSGQGLIVVTQDDSTIAVVRGFPTVTSAPAQALSTSLLADADAFYAPTAIASQFLQPTRIADPDIVYAFTSSSYLQPALTADSDSIFAADVQRISGKPKQTVAPSRVVDVDTIFGPGVANIRLTLAPQTLAPDDAFYAFTNTRFVQPSLAPADDVVRAADVGWQVRSHPARREAGGATRSAAHQVRDGREPQDRQGAWPNGAAVNSAAR
jgi:hypothetical protein